MKYIIIIIILIILIYFSGGKIEKLKNIESNNISDKYKIQRNIFQTLKNKEIPNRLKKYIDKNIDLNKEFNRYIFDDKDIEEYIKEKDDNIYKIYKKIDHGVVKADLFRFLVIYYEGGIYYDIDIFLKKKMDIHNDLEFFTFKTSRGELTSHFFGAKKKNKIVKKALDLCLENINKNKKIKSKTHGLAGICGPAVFTKAAEEYLNIQDIKHGLYIGKNNEKIKIFNQKEGKENFSHKDSFIEHFYYFIDTYRAGQTYWGFSLKNL